VFKSFVDLYYKTSSSLAICCDAGTAGKVLHQCVRLKSKGKFSGRNTIGKRRGWKKYENDYVERGMIIFRQYGLHVYPGENVRYLHVFSNSLYMFRHSV